jgi:KTSC domain-containing protein
MKKVIGSILLIIIFNDCIGQDCNDLPNSFSSYKSAIAQIEKTDFLFTDKLPPNSSTWILSADYYSCDKRIGYLIYSTVKGEEFIHQGVPITIWKEFISAKSKGMYYDHNIKDKYKLQLR